MASEDRRNTEENKGKGKLFFLAYSVIKFLGTKIKNRYLLSTTDSIESVKGRFPTAKVREVKPLKKM